MARRKSDETPEVPDGTAEATDGYVDGYPAGIAAARERAAEAAKAKK